MIKRENVVVSIPHAGTGIPSDIRSRIRHDDFVLRNESDLFSDRIFDIEGVRKVMASHSRIIGDPNRAPDEIYTEGALRTLGVVMLTLPEGGDVFTSDPTLDEMSEWITRHHLPYQRALATALKGAEFLIDGHSMWSVAAQGHYGGRTSPRADIVLGNQHFCSCSAETTDFFASFFSKKGYSVAINNPYAGRYILGTYCSRLYMPGIQIEINRKLFLDEATLEPRDTDVLRLHDEFDELVTSFCSWYKGPQKPEQKKPVDLSEHSG